MIDRAPLPSEVLESKTPPSRAHVPVEEEWDEDAVREILSKTLRGRFLALDDAWWDLKMEMCKCLEPLVAEAGRQLRHFSRVVALIFGAKR